MNIGNFELFVPKKNFEIEVEPDCIIMWIYDNENGPVCKSFKHDEAYALWLWLGEYLTPSVGKD